MLFFYLTLIETEEARLTFQYIYDHYGGAMFAIAYTILKDKYDAEDAVQDAFLGIAVSINSVPVGSREMQQAYVLAAARNAAVKMAMRKKKREAALVPEYLQPTSTEDVFETICRSEDYAMLRRLVSSLPEKYREVLMLRYVHGLKPRYIAALLHRKVTTVQQQLSRGKNMLVALYEEEGFCHD